MTACLSQLLETRDCYKFVPNSELEREPEPEPSQKAALLLLLSCYNLLFEAANTTQFSEVRPSVYLPVRPSFGSSVRQSAQDVAFCLFCTLLQLI